MKRLKQVYQSSGMHWVGDGFPVRSVFSYQELGEELDPFLLLDYAAPYEFGPTDRRRGVGAHPHRGFETVTLSLQGEVEHRDSAGGGGTIGPGDVQWMTAASGLLHEEFHSEAFAKSGGVFEMLQLWVNLPAKDKGAPPRYQTLARAAIPVMELPDAAGTLRVVAGAYEGRRGPAQTFTPIDLWEIRLSGGKSTPLPAPEGHTTALFVMQGDLLSGGEKRIRRGDLAVFEREGSGLVLRAETDSHLLLMGGAPIGEPIVGQGPFVMNRRSEILEAFRDFQMGKMGTM